MLILEEKEYARGLEFVVFGVDGRSEGHQRKVATRKLPAKSHCVYDGRLEL
jgi:hypothetical protein